MKSVVEGKRVAERVINIAGQFLNLKVDYLGFVYDDPVVHTSVVRQKPFLILEPKSRAALCIRHLVGRLENYEYRDGKGIPDLPEEAVRVEAGEVRMLTLRGVYPTVTQGGWVR